MPLQLSETVSQMMLFDDFPFGFSDKKFYSLFDG